jgi:hypothetical protein
MTNPFAKAAAAFSRAKTNFLSGLMQAHPIDSYTPEESYPSDLQPKTVQGIRRDTSPAGHKPGN